MDLDEALSMTPTTEIAPLQLPCETPTLGERYRLGRLLGSGGMADVFLADDLCLERTVAIKVLHGVHATDGSGLERFRREAIALAGIASPNVARIHDAKLEAGRAYLVMEHINGVTVDEEVTRTGIMDPARAEAVLAQILDALVAIHAKGLIHRDIKPSNVLLEPSGRVVLIDLGIAYDRRRSPLTEPGMAAGTPGYFAPELEPAPASDIYQVGLLMLFMLTGVDRARSADVGDLEVIVGTLPIHLARVVRCALAVDPAQRFESAQSMRADLQGARSSVTSEVITAACDAQRSAREQRVTTQIAPCDLLGLLADARPRPGQRCAELAGRTTTVSPPGYLVGYRPPQVRYRRPRVHMQSIQMTAAGPDVVDGDAASPSIVSGPHSTRSAALIAALSIVAIAITVVVGLL